jgi:hypothetical protein
MDARTLESEDGVIEAKVERFAPILVAVVALFTGGAWLASHGGPPQYPQYPQQPQYPPQPQVPQPPPEPPPKPSSCANCADCMSVCEGCEGCDVGDCDLSGCGDIDCSGVDCTHVRARTGGSTGFLVLLLPLALLDAWRRGLLRRA